MGHILPLEQMNWVYTCKRMKLDSYLTYARLVTSVMSDSLWSHGLQPARLLCPWDFPGKNTEVGCHFLLHPYLTPYAKLNSKRIKDLNLRAQFSSKQRGYFFFNLGFGKGFFLSFLVFLKECAVFIVRHQTRRPGEGNGTQLQYSCLENPMDGGAWWAAVHGVAKSRTWLNNFTFPFHFHALEKEMAAHSSVLAWRIPGMAEPGGLPSMGSHRVRHDWHDLAAAAAADKEARAANVQKTQTLWSFAGNDFYRQNLRWGLQGVWPFSDWLVGR